MKITVLGAAGTVTGSRTLVESGDTRVLVDCGLFQGVRALRQRNWEALPFAPAELDAVLLTHAHIDHSGYLPALVRDGFTGPILCTEPTVALCEILLPDSGHLQEEDARYANRKRFSRHDPALPLYTEEDARKVPPSFRAVPFGEAVEVGALKVTFNPAGHILGAAGVHVSDGTRRAYFSGDVGPPDHLVMKPPAPPLPADVLFMESTYGDRRHGDDDPVEAVAQVLERTIGRGGILLVPSFAVGRCQTLLYILHEIFRTERVREVPVFVNSPMATSVTHLFQRWHEYHRLDREGAASVRDVAGYVRTVEESMELTQRWFPMVILSASGMCTGGRVLHHLKALLPDHRNTVMLPGFQAPGTRGGALAAGAEEVKIHGGWVPVRAEVVQLDLLSAHADGHQLVEWAAGVEVRPRRVVLNHGEPAASEALRQRLESRLQWDVVAAEQGMVLDLDRL